MESLKRVLNKYPNPGLGRVIPKLGSGRTIIPGLNIVGDSVPIDSVPCRLSLPSVISPWLIIPPGPGGIGSLPNDKQWFYSLAEQVFLGIYKKTSLINNNIQFVGSSHGWIALFNRVSQQLLLSNPLNGNEVHLPPIDTLPIPKSNLKTGIDCVSKVIISQSPRDEFKHKKCCVMMSFGPRNELAFCHPSISKKWTQVAAVSGNYESFVFSKKNGFFFCVRGNGEFESWDLQNPDSPRGQVLGMDYPRIGSQSENVKKLGFLVANPFSGCLYLVIRLVMVEEQGRETCGFKVYKCDPNTSTFEYMDRSLDGLAFFIGKNHCFMIEVDNRKFPGLRPNTIYFAEVDELISHNEEQQIVGTFDYDKGTFLASSLPCVKSSGYAMWFSPTDI